MPRSPRRISFALALAAACLVSGAGRAADIPRPPTRASSLSWVELPGAEDCGGTLLMANLVEDYLGRHALVALPQADLSIEGYVEHPGDGWHARIVVRDTSGAVLGQRELTSSEPSCDELRGSAALAIALMIDPDAIARAPVALPAASIPPEPAAATPPPPSPPPPIPQTPAPAPHAPFRVEVDVGPVLAFGMLPSVALGPVVGATVRSPSFWRARAFGAALLPQSLRAPGGASGEATVDFGGLTFCPLALEDRAHRAVELCAGALVGALTVAGSGFPTSHTQTTAFVDALGEAALILPLGAALVIRIGGGVAVAAQRNRIVYDDTSGAAQDLYVSPLIAGQGMAGVGIVLP